jgi:hypothetical protein
MGEMGEMGEKKKEGVYFKEYSGPRSSKERRRPAPTKLQLVVASVITVLPRFWYKFYVFI